MSNALKFEKEARDVLKKGAEQVYKAVSSTLGARGRNVVRQRFGAPKITNDGYTIAKEIDLADPFEKQGADLLKEAASKTVREAGDGTTTSIVLAYSMFTEGLKLIEQGENPAILRSKIEHEVERVQKRLKEMVIPVKEHEDLEKIATISVESPEYGKIIADSIRTVGKDGIIIVDEDSTTIGIRSEEIHGYRFDKGLENPYLVTDTEKMEAVLEGQPGSPISILVADKSWNLIGDLLPMFEELKKNNIDKVLIIAEEISGELMQFITVNRVKLRFHAVVVKCPFNKDMLEDITSLVGGEAVLNAKGIINVTKAHLGTAQRVIVTQDTTTIIGGGGDPTARIEALRQQITDCEDDYQKEKLQERLAKLTGKTIMLKVGANTEAEARYLKDKLDDAVAATRAAVEEGVVAGGGMALMRIANKFYGEGKEASPAEVIMYMTLYAPIKKILENSGVGDNSDQMSIFSQLSQSETSGYDALKGEVVPDIIAAGIIDPLKVTRCALKNAASLACMLITTDTVIAELPDPK